MAITTPAGFRITSTEPVDTRIILANEAARYALQSINVYEGLLVYQQDTQAFWVVTDTGSVGNSAGWTAFGGGSSANYKTYVAKLTQRAEDNNGDPVATIATNNFDFIPNWQTCKDRPNHRYEGKYFFNFSSSVNPDKTAPTMMPNSSSNLFSTIETNPKLNYYYDDTFATKSFSDEVISLALYTSGSTSSTLVGGKFTGITGGNTYYGLLKINNLDNTIDDTFIAPGYGFDSNGVSINAIVVEPNNETVLIGGYFADYSYNGGSAAPFGIARLSGSNGVIDSVFTSNVTLTMGKGTSGTITSLAIEPSTGNIYAGGEFNNNEVAGMFTPNNIVKLNRTGSIDSAWKYVSSQTNGGFDDLVRAIAVQADGKVLIGGQFTTYKTLNSSNVATTYSVRCIVRLNADGTYDSTFNTTGFTSNYGGAAVNAITIQSDGKILVGGYFTTYDGDPISNGLVRLNSDGSIDESFTLNTQYGFIDGGTIYSIALQQDYGILVGGVFTKFNAITTGISGIVRLTDSGSLLSTLGGGVSGKGTKIIPLPYNKCLVGGTLLTTYYDDKANTVSTPRLTRLYASYDVVLTTTDVNNTTADNLITNTLVEVTQYT